MEPASFRCPEEAWLEGVKRRGAGEAVVDSLQMDRCRYYLQIQICRYRLHYYTADTNEKINNMDRCLHCAN